MYNMKRKDGNDMSNKKESELNKLKDMLMECLPFVTDAIDDPAFKPSGKASIRGLEKRIRNALDEKPE